MIHLDFLSSVNATLIAFLIGLSFIYLLFGLDDLFIDVVAIFGGLRPKRFTPDKMKELNDAPEKRIAIIVPAWDEGNIIDRMLFGNLDRIDYKNYDFFIGVYPNDPKTGKKVEEVGKIFPNVHAVVNFRNGPSSKGQILNHVVRQILQFEKENAAYFHAFHMQDAEDLIHPKVLKLVNDKLNDYDFVQVPVFSLEVRGKQLVAGVYVDEFAENHTKDILVREKLGAAIPSAGVGTTLSRALVLKTLELRNGELFNEGALTEDYELGIRSHALGFRPHVACHYFSDENGKKDFIATREYFPKKFSRSVRQKTRWTVGIALQGWRNLGWVGGLANRYFLMRDRKGIATNIATFVGYPVAALTALYAYYMSPEALQHAYRSNELRVVLAVDLLLMIHRFLMRTICVARVYGVRAAVPVVVRWPLGNTVNALAGLNAMKNDIKSRVTKVSLAWAKTEHELPELFGQTSRNLEVAR